MNRDTEDLHEVLQRTRRIETKVMTLGNALGVAMKEENRVIVNRENQTLQLSSLDVPLTLLTHLSQRNDFMAPVDVLFEGKRVATLYF